MVELELDGEGLSTWSLHRNTGSWPWLSRVCGDGKGGRKYNEQTPMSKKAFVIWAQKVIYSEVWSVNVKWHKIGMGAWFGNGVCYELEEWVESRLFTKNWCFVEHCSSSQEVISFILGKKSILCSNKLENSLGEEEWYWYLRMISVVYCFQLCCCIKK